jgi:hypothetical protein
MFSAVFCFNWLRGRGLGKSGGGRNNFVLYSPINYNWHFPDSPRPQKTVPRADKKKSRWVVKYSAVYVESKNAFRFAQSSGCRNGKPIDSKYAVVKWNGQVVERYRSKRTQPKTLDGASMRDPSLNLPQGGEIDNRLRINQPRSQAPPE